VLIPRDLHADCERPSRIKDLNLDGITPFVVACFYSNSPRSRETPVFVPSMPIITFSSSEKANSWIVYFPARLIVRIRGRRGYFAILGFVALAMSVPFSS